MTHCYFCGCNLPESEPLFTFHFYINESNIIPHSQILTHSFPIAYIQITHDIDNKGIEIINEPYVVYSCSYNCFLLMEEYIEEHKFFFYRKNNNINNFK